MLIRTYCEWLGCIILLLLIINILQEQTDKQTNKRIK